MKTGSGFRAGPPPANGGEVAVTGGQTVDPAGNRIVGGDRVLPRPGGAAGPQPVPSVVPNPRRF